MTEKMFAGARLRELRQRLDLTQTAFAARIGVSLSYLNQMERNHRPLSRAALAAMAEAGLDVSLFETDETGRLIADLSEALVDPIFGARPKREEVEAVASGAPGMARAFLEAHRSLRAANERLAALDERLGAEGVLSPWEEVRDFFHYCDNYIDAVDHAAESFAARAGTTGAALARWLTDRRGVQVVTGGDALRRYEPEQKRLTLGADAQTFHIAHQIALIEQEDLIEATLDLANFRTDAAREICKFGLANYFAGAVVMPYAAFAAAAAEARHDIEMLAARFDVSLEQVCHRLSTLQRPGAKGVPFFFVRVDQSGTITKRHSATRLQFARYGGACPLWNVHQAFETPGRIIRQLAETPDGVRYLCLARDVAKPGGAFRAPTRRYAIGLGCEVRHADQMVYADDLDVGNDAAYQPIGVSCRICERADCHQRSVPPLEKTLTVDHDRREIVPYRVS